eukprot:6734907-Pyramimonas_sp.AAC.1
MDAAQDYEQEQASHLVCLQREAQAELDQLAAEDKRELAELELQQSEEAAAFRGESARVIGALKGAGGSTDQPVSDGDCSLPPTDVADEAPPHNAADV